MINLSSTGHIAETFSFFGSKSILRLSSKASAMVKSVFKDLNDDFSYLKEKNDSLLHIDTDEITF